jgi:hypothetical protein
LVRGCIFLAPALKSNDQYSYYLKLFVKKIAYFIIPKLMIKSKGGENFASRNPELNDSIIKD